MNTLHCPSLMARFVAYTTALSYSPTHFDPGFS
jgi:hypothetical protein